MNPRRALSTACSAAALLVAFDLLWVLVVDRGLLIGYLALTATLLLIPATLIGLIFVRTANPPPWVSATLAGSTAWL